ncbi:MAG: TetR/AcrR family transcriptional regulator [Pseudomonadota bacterium]
MSESDRKPKRGRPQTLDEDATLKVAVDAYWRADPADVSINALCKLAEVSKPSLYRVFKSEDGLTCAALGSYAETVLSDIFVILGQRRPLSETLPALIEFASHDPKMERGCLFYKMRAGKHRLGPQTQRRVEDLNGAAVDAFKAYLEDRQTVGDWNGTLSAKTAAHYLVEQIGLALTQRASGADKDMIADTLELALTALQRA